MIELVAHKDNSWPSAFRLHMKDTGMLLAIGRDVTALVEARLKEEGIEGDFRVTFADGSRAKRGAVERAMPQDEPELDRHGKPVKQAEVYDPFSDFLAEVDRHGKPVKTPEPDNPFADPVEELWTPTAAAPKPKAKPVEKFVLPKLKPIEKRPAGAETASVKRAAAKKPIRKKQR